jgi:hypothetical protein
MGIGISEKIKTLLQGRRVMTILSEQLIVYTGTPALSWAHLNSFPSEWIEEVI